jgi:DNA polymerase-4
MSTLTRSATLPYATADEGRLTAMARRLLLDPLEVGPIRLVGVGFSGLSDVLQESLFPELEHQELELSDAAVPEPAGESALWRVGDDLDHPAFGHGWVQGAGHGVVSVRFETRSSGPGVMRTFAIDNAELTRANPVDSLDWPDCHDHTDRPDEPDRSAPAGDDGIDG